MAGGGMFTKPIAPKTPVAADLGGAPASAPTAVSKPMLGKKMPHRGHKPLGASKAFSGGKR